MIFVDAGYLLALAQPADSLHLRALAWARQVREELLVTEYVLLESVNGLSKPRDRARAQEIISFTRGGYPYRFVHASPELLEAGLRLHRERPDKEWSLTDCLSFLVMRELGVTQALAYDEHFEQAGFASLLRRDPPA